VKELKLVGPAEANHNDPQRAQAQTQSKDCELLSCDMGFDESRR
jgi:hypothetical protein